MTPILLDLALKAGFSDPIEGWMGEAYEERLEAFAKLIIDYEIAAKIAKVTGELTDDPYCYTYTEGGEEYFAPKGAYVPDNAQPLYTRPQPAAHNDCARSHPHENMDAMCELRAEIARLKAELMRMQGRELKLQMALSQQPADEPYGCVTVVKREGCADMHWFYRHPEPPYLDNAAECHTVYTRPQPAAWVGLTDEDISQIEDEYIVDYRIPAGSAWNFAKDIEAKLRERNGGKV